MQAHEVLTNLCYPPACLLCHAPLPACAAPDMLTVGAAGRPATGSAHPAPPVERDEVLCDACRGDMRQSRPPCCRRCGLSLDGAYDASPVCAGCRARPPAFDRAQSPWQYAGAVPGAIRAFKYRGRWRIGAWLASRMAASVPAGAIDLVVPVPLHWMKRLLRGADSSADLARRVARALDAPCAPQALRRTRWTATQTALSPAGRRSNVRGAFAARSRFVAGRSVLLIDDVLTTGATADACAEALKAAGAARVVVLTAARTPLSGAWGVGRGARDFPAPCPLPPAPNSP